ncbi:MAG: ATP phosphoribosyltransferase regulatory subunit [Aggregatilineales bacterium]
MTLVHGNELAIIASDTHNFEIFMATDLLQYLEQTLHQHMRLYGYTTIETPIIENADIFLTRAGDKIIDRLLTFEKRGQSLALRPEFTASAAQHYIRQNVGETVRWQFRGHVFEDLSDRSSHDYQRYNIGAELIGIGGIDAEAEIISMAAHGLLKAGITDWQLVIGHSGLQTHLLRQYLSDSRIARLLLSRRAMLQDKQQMQILQDEIISSLESSSKYTTDQSANTSQETEKMLDVLLDSTRYGTTMGGRSRKAIAERLLEKQNRSEHVNQVTEAVAFLKTWADIRNSSEVAFDEIADLIDENDTIGLQLLSQWEATIDLLEAYNIHPERIVIQPDLARNWEYYTGIVFGIRLADKSYIAAGGRYDDLVLLLGNDKSVPAIGMAYYADRILPLLTDAKVQPAIILLESEVGTDTSQVAMWAQYLREQDFTVIISKTADLIPSVVLKVSTTGQIFYNDKQYAIEDIDLLTTNLRDNS